MPGKSCPAAMSIMSSCAAPPPSRLISSRWPQTGWRRALGAAKPRIFSSGSTSIRPENFPVGACGRTNKNFSADAELALTIGYYAGAGWWTTNMRALLLGVILSTVALPCLAQTILKSEPLVLAPYEIAFVQDASCPAGKVLKVTGAIRGLHRKKACVALAAEQASLAVATP